jgi:hypothetical protein
MGNRITHRNNGNKGNDGAQKFDGTFINQLTLIRKVTNTVISKITMVMLEINLIINVNRSSRKFPVGLTD